MQELVDKIATALQAAEVLAHPDAVVLKGFPRAVQLDRHSCGEKAVWSVLRYFGIRASHPRLERMLRTDEDDGTDVADIKRVFRHFKLECRTLRKPTVRTLQSCIEDGCPVLVSMYEGEHYACVWGMSATHVFVMNPSIDARLSGVGSVGSVMTKADFRFAWDQWGIVVSKP